MLWFPFLALVSVLNGLPRDGFNATGVFLFVNEEQAFIVEPATSRALSSYGKTERVFAHKSHMVVTEDTLRIWTTHSALLEDSVWPFYGWFKEPLTAVFSIHDPHYVYGLGSQWDAVYIPHSLESMLHRIRNRGY